jgi:SAM-dependent methyltransferase
LETVEEYRGIIWIGYITGYRGGGAGIRRAALTLEAEKRKTYPDRVVRCEPVETKRAFVDAMAGLRARNERMFEFHLLGHSALYGFMFNTCELPEQFSPHEWKMLHIPFTKGGEAFLHGCRTARWFAPFFARTFGVPANGYHWFTTFSKSRTHFRWAGPFRSHSAPLYVVGCPGKKSHGLLGSMMKYSGLLPVERFKRLEPSPVEGDPTYDSIASLYDVAFGDIRYREDEWSWIRKHLPKDSGRVLDVGCGNGALLFGLKDQISYGVGVDTSRPLVAIAQERAKGIAHLDFQTISGPSLPFPDQSFDVIVSLFSFRYLDWDPMMAELRRVLAPSGRIIIIDLVSAALEFRDLPAALRSKIRCVLYKRRFPVVHRAYQILTKDPRWATVNKYNPMRLERELRLYLESRFPEGKLEVLSIRPEERTLAFDSGPLQPGWVAPQSYP